MGINVSFFLGKGSSTLFDHRQVTIRNVGVFPHTTVHQSNEAGDTEVLTVELPENATFQLELRDYVRGFGTGAPAVMNFNTHTALLSFQSGAGGGPKIIAVEETSSSSSSSSTSSLSSSTSSASSLSSSSTSSLSSSSTSSGSELSSSSSSSTSSLSSSSLSSSSSSSSSSGA